MASRWCKEDILTDVGHWTSPQKTPTLKSVRISRSNVLFHRRHEVANSFNVDGVRDIESNLELGLYTLQKHGMAQGVPFREIPYGEVFIEHLGIDL